MTHEEYLNNLRPIIPEGEVFRFWGLEGQHCLAWVDEDDEVQYREFWSGYGANKYLKDMAR
jgi:hypothetical protein